MHACERAADAKFSEDPGRAMLVLQSGAEHRYLLIDADLAVNKPVLTAVRYPDGRKGLLLVEARGFEPHADAWVAHLVEDDGKGPHLSLQVVLDVCSWGDDDAKCTSVRASASSVDKDGDGDLALASNQPRDAYDAEDALHRYKEGKRL